MKKYRYFYVNCLCNTITKYSAAKYNSNILVYRNILGYCIQQYFICNECFFLKVDVKRKIMTMHKALHSRDEIDRL